jgi:hypothetical protein
MVHRGSGDSGKEQIKGIEKEEHAFDRRLISVMSGPLPTPTQPVNGSYGNCVGCRHLNLPTCISNAFNWDSTEIEHSCCC